MILLLRLLIIIFFTFAVFSAVKYLISPIRKLKHAHEQKKFYFLDDTSNVRKNFRLTYKGVLLEGEKYGGAIHDSSKVISISIWSESHSEMQELQQEDVLQIESAIKRYYPYAQIDWKGPVQESRE